MSDHPETIPATLLPGLLDGWCGPVDVHWRSWGRDRWASSACFGGLVLTDTSGVLCSSSLADIRLPLARPECRHRLCVILAAGKLCGCPRDAKWASPACPHCRGSEWVRKPAPAWHLLPVAEGGSLPAEYAHHSAALLACFATRVAAGMGGIVDVLPSWRWISKYGRHWRRGDTLDVRERDVLSEGWHAGWRCRRERCAAGPETGEAGKFAADATALVAGFALLDEGGVLRLPPIPPTTVKENDDAP